MLVYLQTFFPSAHATCVYWYIYVQYLVGLRARTKLDKSGYKKYIVRTLLESVAKDYPKETEEVIKSL